MTGTLSCGQPIPAGDTGRAHPLRPARNATLILVAVALLISGLWGCAGRTGVGVPVHQLWEAFSQRRAAAQGAAGVLATASLHYARNGKSHRVTMKLWGAPNLPLRLDMAAGIGASVAMLRESADGWTGYFPSEGAAYESASALLGQRALGMDLPFTLHELAGLAMGTYTDFAPDTFDAAIPMPDGGARFTFGPKNAVTSMTLDAQGRPVVFAGRLRGRQWTIALSRHRESEAAPAARLDISMEPDTRATLRIKRLERRDAWTDDALALPLPPGTTVTPLGSPMGNTGG